MTYYAANVLTFLYLLPEYCFFLLMLLESVLFLSSRQPFIHCPCGIGSRTVIVTENRVLFPLPYQEYCSKMQFLSMKWKLGTSFAIRLR